MLFDTTDAFPLQADTLAVYVPDQSLPPLFYSHCDNKDSLCQSDNQVFLLNKWSVLLTEQYLVRLYM